MAEITIDGQSVYLLGTNIDASGGIVSAANSSTATLGVGASFTGGTTECQRYCQITAAVNTDQPGLLYIEQGVDGDNWDHTSSFTIGANTPEAHQCLVIAQKFRVRFVNTGAEQTTFRLQTILHETAAALTRPISATMTSLTDAQITRAILTGQNLSGGLANVGVTVEDFLKVYNAGPSAAYGELQVALNTPIVQATFLNGVLFPDIFNQLTVGSGAITISQPLVSVDCGATPGSFAFLSTRRIMKERPGQGKLIRFSALFSSPVANSQQLAGLFSSANGFAFGYLGTSFGIHHLYGGYYEQRKLTITTASSTGENATVDSSPVMTNVFNI